MTELECPVCMETFNKVGHKIVTCNKCNFKACNKCCKRYLIGEETEPMFNDAHCMACKKDWDREFLADNLSKSWVNGYYKIHRENILMERQKSFLPSTQEFVESQNQIEKNQTKLDKLNIIKNEKMIIIEQKIRELKNKLRGIERNCTTTNRTYIHNSELHRNFINGIINENPGPPDKDGISTLTSKEELEPKNIIHGNCPVIDCRGFVGRGWVCGVCETRICSHCMEPKEYTDKQTGIGHVCNESKRKSVDLIKKDSKMCPGCHIPIFKIEGCYMMWCTQCHITFHYRTGEIIKNERNHNPHYTEYMQQQGNDGNQLIRGDDVNRCGRIDPAALKNAMKMSTRMVERFVRNDQDRIQYGLEIVHGIERRIPIRINVPEQFSERLLKFNNIMEFVYETMNYRIITVNDVEIRTRKLRINYLKNIIDETVFKREIQKIEKASSKQHDINQVYDMFCNVVQDYLQALIEKRIGEELVENKLHELLSDCNIRLWKINRMYGHYTQGIMLNPRGNYF
jgi:hypothetical protein